MRGLLQGVEEEGRYSLPTGRRFCCYSFMLFSILCYVQDWPNFLLQTTFLKKYGMYSTLPRGAKTLISLRFDMVLGASTIPWNIAFMSLSIFLYDSNFNVEKKFCLSKIYQLLSLQKYISRNTLISELLLIFWFYFWMFFGFSYFSKVELKISYLYYRLINAHGVSPELGKRATKAHSEPKNLEFPKSPDILCSFLWFLEILCYRKNVENDGKDTIISSTKGIRGCGSPNWS